MRSSRFALLSLIFAIGLSCAGGALASQEMEQPPRETVHLRDVDLSTNAGLRTARARLRGAAIRVCGDFPQPGLLPIAAVSRCRTRAMREANARLDAIIGLKR